MTNVEKVKLFINTNDAQTVKDYHDRLFENLKELNEKEEKYVFWQFIVTFLYLFAGNITFSNLSLGPVSVTDATVVVKIIPVIFIYIFYTLHSITVQKKEVTLAFETISASRFSDILNKENPHSFLARIYKPHAFTNSITSLFREKPHIIEAFIGFIILLPLIVIGLAPYFIAGSMLIDLYTNHMTDNLGKLSFWITLWLCFIILFHMVIGGIRNYKEEQ